MTLYEDDESAYRLFDASKEQSSTYADAAIFILKLYLTDSNKANATSEIFSFKKNSWSTKVVCCDNTYLKDRTLEVFAEGILTTIQHAIEFF